MTVTKADVDALLEALDETRQAWIEGRLGWGESAPITQAADMTIFGPFGGEAARADDARQARAASAFKGGTGTSEVVQVIVEGDLVVVAGVERSEVAFEGVDNAPWVLRTTQVFRHDRGRWTRLHRHADPLIHPRSLVETRRLLHN